MYWRSFTTSSIIQKTYHSSDGFAERILFCTPKPHLLKVQWAEKLQCTKPLSLMEPAQLIQQWHPEKEDNEYTFCIEARRVYAKFNDEIVNKKMGGFNQYDTIGKVLKVSEHC